LQYLVPTFNFFLGWLAYNEKLDVTRLVGFAFVWFGLVILITDSLRSSAKKVNNA
jgi:EamA domain-containing membrane protein RarD